MKKKVLIPFVILILISFVAGGYALFHRYYSLLNIEPRENPVVEEEDQPGEPPPSTDKGIRNILLLGVDARNEDVMTRTDTMIITTINEKTKTITLTSLMRDIYIFVPGYGSSRLNAATVYGGPDLLIQTIEENFDIPIDHYLLTDFFEFEEIVDHFGGVDIEVSAEEIEHINAGADHADSLEPSQAGLIHLNGKQALAYVRIRDVGNADFERTERQRTVVTKLIEKGKAMNFGDQEKVVREVLPKLTTDIREGDLLSLLWKSFTEYKAYPIQDHRIPEDGTWEDAMVDGMAVLEIDFEQNKESFFSKAYEGR